MRIFNIDCHIAMYEDRHSIFTQLGHKSDGCCLSGHCWVTGRQQGAMDPLNAATWDKPSRDMRSEFVANYTTAMRDVDVIVIGYQPSLAWWFEPFNKPMIVVACMRYEYPYAPGKCTDLDIILQGCIRIANNRADAHYCNVHQGGHWRHIESLCDYATPGYTGRRKYEWYNQSRFTPQNSTWSEIADFKGIFWTPWNYSMMGLFERYWQNIPIVVPDPDSLMKWPGAMCQARWDGAAWGSPNGELADMLPRADFYNLPHIVRINDDEPVDVQFKRVDVRAVSAAMAATNVERKARIMGQWADVLKQVA